MSRDGEMTALKRELTQVKEGTGFFKRSGSVLRERVEVRYRMIERCRGAFPIRMMCRSLKVSPSGYYDWRERPLSERAKDNQRLLSKIKVIHVDSDGVFGSSRVWEALRYKGEGCGVNRVARLMQKAGIQGVPQKKRWRKKESGQRPADVMNHLVRNFQASEANARWVTDITYIRTAEGWLYLCVVLDLYSKLVVG